MSGYTAALPLLIKSNERLLERSSPAFDEEVALGLGLQRVIVVSKEAKKGRTTHE